jgi:hypothetical protein
MRVVCHLKRFFDWRPVPSDVAAQLTDADKASGLVKPNRDGSGWEMRASFAPPGGAATSACEMAIPESEIISEIIDEKNDVRRSGAILTRKQAVAKHVKNVRSSARASRPTSRRRTAARAALTSRKRSSTRWPSRT